MMRFFSRVGVFFRIFRGCFSKAWQETDCHYNIPKSRFKDPVSDAQVRNALPKREKSVPRNAFLGSFRDCVAKAWEETDTQYYIPKTRFQDAEYNEKAYRYSREEIWSRIGAHFGILKSCLSTAWEETDHYYYLPKSRYQDPVFLKDKMDSAPKSKGLLLLKPHYIGQGVVGEINEEGWIAGSSQDPLDRVFVIHEDGAGGGRKPEIGSE